VYVANSSSLQSRGPGTVAVVDTATDTVTATIPVGDNPLDIVLSPDGATAYVSSSAPTCWTSSIRRR
jgi:YVTN family beta-propeller protein